MKDLQKAAKEIQDALVLQYLPALKAMAYKMKERLPQSVDVNDLISVGSEVMIKLARRYDSSINDSFWGYARTRVQGSMLDYLRSLDTLSRTTRRLVKAIDREISKYFSIHQEEPSNEYLAEIIGESIDKIKEARIALEVHAVIPLDDYFNASVEDDTKERIEKEELLNIIYGILDTLPKQEQLIVQLYYFEDLTFSEIAKLLEMSSTKVSFLHKQVIEKIKTEVGKKYG